MALVYDDVWKIFSPHRTALPVAMLSRNEFSVWAVLRQCIGKVRYHLYKCHVMILSPPPLPLSLSSPPLPSLPPHPYWTHTTPNIFLVILAGFVKNYNARFVCNSPFKYLISICSNQKEEITNLSLWLADFLWNKDRVATMSSFHLTNGVHWSSVLLFQLTILRLH